MRSPFAKHTIMSINDFANLVVRAKISTSFMSGSRKWSIQLFPVVKHLLKRGSFSDSEVSQLSEQRLIDAVWWVSLDSLAAS